MQEFPDKMVSTNYMTKAVNFLFIRKLVTASSSSEWADHLKEETTVNVWEEFTFGK
jgi:hypothetical protein